MNKVIFVVLLGLGFSVTAFAQQTGTPAAPAKPAEMQAKKYDFKKMDEDGIFKSTGFKKASDAITYCVAIQNRRIQNYPDVVPDINGNLMQQEQYLVKMKRDICAMRVDEMIWSKYVAKDASLKLVHEFDNQIQREMEVVERDEGRRFGGIIKRADAVAKILQNKFLYYVNWAVK